MHSQCSPNSNRILLFIFENLILKKDDFIQNDDVTSKLIKRSKFEIVENLNVGKLNVDAIEQCMGTFNVLKVNYL